MSTYRVELSSGAQLEVEADELSTRDSGSLWFLKHTPPSRPMETVLVLNARVWKSVCVAPPTPTDEARERLPDPAPESGQEPEPIYKEMPIPDPPPDRFRRQTWRDR